MTAVYRGIWSLELHWAMHHTRSQFTQSRFTHSRFIEERLMDPAAMSVVAEPPVNCVVVDLSSERCADSLATSIQSPACVVIGFDSLSEGSVSEGSVSDGAQSENRGAVWLDSDVPAYIDVVANSEDDLALLQSRITANPLASAMLVALLRQSLELSVEQALLCESLAYSSLQHGAEFARFCENRKPGQFEAASEPAVFPAVFVERYSNRLQVTLNRPAKHNAFSARMRDELCEALQVARLDNTIDQIILRGAGESFCAGGDLDEFGLARDASIAHFSRYTQSAAALLHGVSARVVAELKGACIGAGIELPAFARKICAAPNSFFELPEVALGLVPGAGGTVSLPRRIGRLRTAWLGLSGRRIDAEIALSWGLIDQIVE